MTRVPAYEGLQDTALARALIRILAGYRSQMRTLLPVGSW